MTKKAAYFTDSQQPAISRIAIGKHGAPGDLTTIPLTGDYQHVAGQFNLNGIVATANGKALIAVQTVAKKLFLIDPASGATKAIDTGTYDLANGDGLLLHGKTLYVVQNRSNQIAVFRLSRTSRRRRSSRSSRIPTSTSPRRSTRPASGSTP